MKIRLLVGVLAALAFSAEDVAAVQSPSATTPLETEVWAADFEGVEVDLRDGWDGARACLTDGVITECWDSEAEMLLEIAAQTTEVEVVPAAVAGALIPGTSSFRQQPACSSFLRLYTGANYSGAVLAVSSRFVFLNLSSVGFNNSASSYRVGACPAALYDGSAGGGPIYPGATHEYAWGPSMISGWDNRISSVYLG